MLGEAGATVYSASEFASQEMPDVDVSLRGAASIARRLQDPLAELVKIDPKSIGVGQYQHDVNQSDLARSLDTVVEDCVNSVGVDLNTASVPLLARVSGLSQTVAKSVVRWRESVSFMASSGVRTFYEVGAGKVLSGLVRIVRATASVEMPAANAWFQVVAPLLSRARFRTSL